MANESAQAAYLPWRAPEIDDSSHLAPGDIETARKLAWQEGYDDGYSVGLEAGTRDGARRVQYLDEILCSLSKPFEELDTVVSEQLLTLVGKVARAIVRREIETDSSYVVNLIREGLAALPVAANDVRVYVSPEDAELVRASLVSAGEGSGWRLESDPSLARGGCRITTSASQIDASPGTRLSRLLASMANDDTDPSDA